MTGVRIITEGFPKDEEIKLDSISCVYYQNPDCTESSDDFQEITIETRDGGGGKFIHIKTDGWSVSDEDDLVELIKDFKKKYEQSPDNS